MDVEAEKVLYEDLSAIHQRLGDEDWQRRLVEILRIAANPANDRLMARWERDHGYRPRAR